MKSIIVLFVLMISNADLKRDRVFYYKAVSLARFSSYTTRVGAIAAHNNKILAGAFNSIRNDHPNTEHGTATYHAERNCLGMVSGRLLGRITLYVARLDKGGHRVASRPCKRCMVMLGNLEVREVVYFNGEYIVKEKL